MGSGGGGEGPIVVAPYDFMHTPKGNLIVRSSEEIKKEREREREIMCMRVWRERKVVEGFSSH